MRRKRVFGMTDKMIDNLRLVENDPTFSSLYHIQIGNINSKYSFPGNPCDHSLSSVAEYSPIYSHTLYVSVILNIVIFEVIIERDSSSVCSLEKTVAGFRAFHVNTRKKVLTFAFPLFTVYCKLRDNI